MDRVSGCIRGRSSKDWKEHDNSFISLFIVRVCEVVLNEMEQYSQNQYTETVRRSALRLQHEGKKDAK